MNRMLAAEKEKEMGLPEGRLWKTYADFAKDHDMILANWMNSSKMMEYFVDSRNDYDEEDDYYYDIYQWFITDECTIRDIDYFDIDIPYFEYDIDDYEVYVIGITHFGTMWDGVDVWYKESEEEEDENS